MFGFLKILRKEKNNFFIFGFIIKNTKNKIKSYVSLFLSFSLFYIYIYIYIYDYFLQKGIIMYSHNLRPN